MTEAMAEAMAKAQAALEVFLEAWKAQNWEGAVEVCQATWRSEVRDPLARVRGLFMPYMLQEWEIERLETPEGLNEGVVVDAFFRADYYNTLSRRWRVRLICETAPYAASLDGAWGVNPNSLVQIEAIPAPPEPEAEAEEVPDGEA